MPGHGQGLEVGRNGDLASFNNLAFEFFGYFDRVIAEAACGCGATCRGTGARGRIILSIELHVARRCATGNDEREAVAFVRTDFNLKWIGLLFRGFPSARYPGVACTALRAFVDQVDVRRRTIRLVANEGVGQRLPVVGKLPDGGENGAAATLALDFPVAGRFNGDGN